MPLLSFFILMFKSPQVWSKFLVTFLIAQNKYPGSSPIFPCPGPGIGDLFRGGLSSFLEGSPQLEPVLSKKVRM